MRHVAQRHRGVTFVSCAAVAAALGAALTGCGLWPSSPSSTSCISWASFSAPQEAFDDAELVVEGNVAPAATTRDVFGYRAAVHTVAVTSVLKGTAEVGASLDVAATPITCTGGELYPDGDPLDVEGEVMLFLTADGGQWRLLSPVQGVLEAGSAGTPDLGSW
ncbi:hypothetical protein [Leucobacter sp. G161]|uniref:hypothetical protein n=1 Tax=Leucobacter sp. G161 TaxID=663704 RepID=UPI00073EEE73|nr:hypothetical protein [Leucobacter sp. G161]